MLPSMCDVYEGLSRWFRLLQPPRNQGHYIQWQVSEGLEESRPTYVPSADDIIYRLSVAAV
jgi:hypothetical protein